MYRSSLPLILSALLSSTPAAAGDAIDTRVAFTLSDDDVLKGPQESVTGSPSLPNSLPSSDNRLFFDDYEKRDTDFENLTHLVLYARQPGFFANLDTEAALVLRAQVLNEKGVQLTDDGSYLKVTKKLGDYDLALTAFPVSADRFRLGYSYDISWGGSAIFKNSRAAPGVRLQLSGGGLYAFVGAKTGLGQITMPDGTIESDTVWGILAGAGVDVIDELRMEAGAGFFDRGTIDKEELKIPDGRRFKTAAWQGFGGSAQAVYHVGIPIGVPIDFRLYRNDPLYREAIYKPEVYNDGVSFLFQSEASFIGQTLQDPERPTSTTIQWGAAADLTGRLKIGKSRMHLLGVYRDLAYILYNVPSLSPFVELPDGITPAPEYFFMLAWDYFIEVARLTPGVSVGLQRPAHVTTVVNAGINPPQSAQVQTLVIRSPTDWQPMDPGDEVAFVFASKLTARWDLSEIMSALLEVQLSHDPNRRRLLQDPLGIPTYAKEDPFIAGFNLLLTARF